MKFNKTKLANGLVVLHEKREVPVTTVMLGVKMGAVYETEKDKGMSHFMEHLCFKGTKKRTTKEIAASLEKVGGDLNAFTSEEETAYHVKIPSNHLELAMDVIFDIFFNPEFPEEEVKKEANVICEEIKMYKDTPRAHTLDKLKENLYKKPFGVSIAGTQENVRGMNREFLLNGHRGLYHPKNAVLVVVGNNEFKEVVELAKKFSVGREGKAGMLQKIEKQHRKNTEARENLEQANVAIGFHFPKLADKERYTAEVFSAILGEGMSSRLFTEVREKRGLVYTVKSLIDADRDYGYLAIYAGTDKEKVDEVIKICLEEFKKMSSITEKELEEGKEQVIGNDKIRSEDCRTTAVSLLVEEFNSGKAEEHYEYEKKIRAVTLKDIKNLVEKYGKDYASFCLLPK